MRLERTCVVCRSKSHKRSLFRIVLRGGTLVWDTEQMLPGRGAYVHQEVECLSKMAQAGRWERAFRQTAGSVAPAELRQVVSHLLELVTKKGVPNETLTAGRRGATIRLRRGK